MKIINQKKMLYIVCICLGIGILIIFFVYALRPEDLNAEINPVNLSQSDINNKENHFYKVYSDSFIADTDIPASYNEKVEVLFAKDTVFDEQTVISTFFKGKNPVRETYEDGIGYRDGESYASISSGSVYYNTTDFQYVAFPTENFSTKYEYNNLLPKYDEVYKQENLNFMTRTEAIDTVSAVLQKLNINVSTDVEVYAIDYKTMQEYQNVKKQEDPETAAMYNLKNEFSQDDEFYILCFTVVENQIPLTHNSYSLWNGERFFMGSNVKVYLSKKGIFYFFASGIYKIQDVAESSNELITAQDAIKKVFDEHNSIVTTDKVTVTSINFEYVCIPYNKNNKEIKLTPAWTLTLSCKSNEISKKTGDTETTIYTRVTTINAITGEKIK